MADCDELREIDMETEDVIDPDGVTVVVSDADAVIVVDCDVVVETETVADTVTVSDGVTVEVVVEEEEGVRDRVADEVIVSVAV